MSSRKPASEKLTENINVPVNRALKRRIAQVAKAAGEPSHTHLARKYIERGVKEDESKVAVAAL